MIETLVTILKRYNFTEEDAKVVSSVIEDVRKNNELLLTQKDKQDLIDRINQTENSLLKTIYIVGFGQFLAIIGLLFGIAAFLMKYLK